eukprot:TRINITY_DN1521_c0_g1_i1.p1 TRINITY_DN1521_c0_g1~~TRINITY_DN1521_c0_g1_i1.p1  ORF type:complete len:244 (-),score=42.14 TRINITY_DN1521_c0_g1_i1:376-1107(-)
MKDKFTAIRADVPECEDMRSVFSHEELVQFFNTDRANRGLLYVNQHWVLDMGACADGTDYMLTARVYHSREQDPAVSCMLLLPQDCASLHSISGACSWFKGNSGQCGHLLACLLQVWRLCCPEEFATQYQKNRDGRKRRTVSDLEQKLSQKSSKKNKRARKAKATTSKKTIEGQAVAKAVFGDLPEKRKKKYPPKDAISVAGPSPSDVSCTASDSEGVAGQKRAGDEVTGAVTRSQGKRRRKC